MQRATPLQIILSSETDSCLCLPNFLSFSFAFCILLSSLNIFFFSSIFSRQPSSTRIRHLLDDSVLEELPSSGITPQALKYVNAFD